MKTLWFGSWALSPLKGVCSIGQTQMRSQLGTQKGAGTCGWQRLGPYTSLGIFFLSGASEKPLFYNGRS